MIRYIDHKMRVIMAASTRDPGNVVNSVIGYMNESEEDKEQVPPNLFD